MSPGGRLVGLGAGHRGENERKRGGGIYGSAEVL